MVGYFIKEAFSNTESCGGNAVKQHWAEEIVSSNAAQ